MFNIGDSVKVKSGDFEGAYGVIASIDETAQTATIQRGTWTSPQLNLADLEAN